MIITHNSGNIFSFLRMKITGTLTTLLEKLVSCVEFVCFSRYITLSHRSQKKSVKFYSIFSQSE